ncbi:MAG TPA: hypothetical protein P5330_09300 [Candidatus Competibacteraceae bacterium]|nr:hypothetical protein [Candidatus Competibacteraceae bacterium]
MLLALNLLQANSEQQDFMEIDMLRITRFVNSSSSAALKVEGRIVGDWVIVLKQAIDAELQSGQTLELDFTDVSFVDEAGIRLLRDLSHNHLSMTHCSGLIQALLNKNNFNQ